MPSKPRDALCWVLAGSAEVEALLTPLIESHRMLRPVRVVHTMTRLAEILDEAAAVLIVGGVREAPRAALPSVFLRTPGGRAVACGWLPAAGERLSRYAQAAAEVMQRETQDGWSGPFVLLAEFDERALNLAATLHAEMSVSGAAVFRWTAERIGRRALLDALGAGPALAIYLGHGNANGWMGYGGCDRVDVAKFSGSPVGTILSLTCATASRPVDCFSFCEEVALAGMAAAVIGAVGRTAHQLNVRLALELARALRTRKLTTVADLLRAPNLPRAALRNYRIIGDPLALLACAPDAPAKCQRVFAPAADDPLPAIPLAAWVS
jgi:hypothetical protein